MRKSRISTFDVFNTVFMILMMIVMIYPLLNVLSTSLSTASEITAGNVSWYPRGFNLVGYRYIIEDGQIFVGYVEEHYAENIYLKTIAEETGLSYAYVSHYFSEHQGIGFADYLNSVRVEKACEMLADLRIPLNEIAERVGFGSMNTFGRNMKKFTGMTPDAYRKANSGR